MASEKWFWSYGPSMNSEAATERSRHLDARLLEVAATALREIDTKLRDIESRIKELE
jgi:hypothetical protein